MTEEQILDVYETLIGVRAAAYRVPGVENLYEPGSPCAIGYENMLDAYARLRERLGITGDDDEDVETIINSLMDIEKIVSLKMFEYGRKMGLAEKRQ